MYRASTPVFYFELGVTAEEVQDFKATFSQYGKTVLEKKKADMTVENNIWRVQLTQEEANLFKTGYANLQVRILNADGDALPTRVYTFGVRSVLNDEVMG